MTPETDADDVRHAIGALARATGSDWPQDAVECLRRLWKRDIAAALGDAKIRAMDAWAQAARQEPTGDCGTNWKTQATIYSDQLLAERAAHAETKAKLVAEGHMFAGPPEEQVTHLEEALRVERKAHAKTQRQWANSEEAIRAHEREMEAGLAETKAKLAEVIHANAEWCNKHKVVRDNLATAVAALEAIRGNAPVCLWGAHAEQAAITLRKIRGEV